MATRIITRGFGSSGGPLLVTRGFGSAGVPSPPTNPTFKDPSHDVTRPGIRWANVPRGRPEFVETNVSGQVKHINAVMGIFQALSDTGDMSGVVRFRFRSLPSSISRTEGRNLDRFGNVIYPGKGL